jgi:hypothetical protein
MACEHRLHDAALMLSGRASEGIAALKTSIRLDPHSPKLARRLTWIIMGHYGSVQVKQRVQRPQRGQMLASIALCSRRKRFPLLKPVRGAMLAAKPPGIWRMSAEV